MVISEEEDRDLGVVHVNHAIRQCGYLDWAVGRGVAPPKEKYFTCKRETESGRIPSLRCSDCGSPMHQVPLRVAEKDPQST